MPSGRKTEKVKGMTKIDWGRKLSSRKFWMAVCGFVSMLLVALGHSEQAATQIASLIMAGATVIGYVIGEGLADAGHAVEEDER